MNLGVMRSLSPNHKGSTSGLPSPRAEIFIMPDKSRARIWARMGLLAGMVPLNIAKPLAVGQNHKKFPPKRLRPASPAPGGLAGEVPVAALAMRRAEGAAGGP